MGVAIKGETTEAARKGRKADGEDAHAAAYRVWCFDLKVQNVMLLYSLESRKFTGILF